MATHLHPLHSVVKGRCLEGEQVDRGCHFQDMIGCSAPSAGRPDDSRLNQTFGQTVNRCHATPIVMLSPMVMNHAIEMTILIEETITIPISSAGGEIAAGSKNQLSGKCSREVSEPRS